MTFVVGRECVDIRQRSCTEVCPVDCIYDVETMLVINPDECIGCGACEPACPVQAIMPIEDVPSDQEVFVAINAAIVDSPDAVKRELTQWQAAA